MKKILILFITIFLVVFLVAAHKILAPSVNHRILGETTKISGGIVPHHLLAINLIEDFFRRLSSSQPETVILLGPNHTEKGDYNVLTSLNNWETANGTILADRTLINRLLEKDLAKQNEKIVTQDQAITAVLPMMKKYLPQTKIVPLLISRNLTQEESKILAGNISALSNTNDIVVASVDFSHYLSFSEAQEKDQTTFAAIKNFDFTAIAQMNNDYLDSPAAINVLLYAMQLKNAQNIELLNHSNSAIIGNYDRDRTTSYFTLLFKP